jgi:hypothetical protein
MLDPLLKLILDLHDRQYEVFSNPARFRVLVAGRRFGKTHLALTEMLYTATKFPNSVSWYVGQRRSRLFHLPSLPPERKDRRKTRWPPPILLNLRSSVFICG